VPPDVPQYFAPGGSSGSWRPVIYGAADVTFSDRKLKVDTSKLVTSIAEVTDGAVPVSWQTAEVIDLSPEALVQQPPTEGEFLPLPAPAARSKNYAAWSRQFADALSSSEQIELLRSPTSGDTSSVGESERDFRARVQHASREARDQKIEALRRKYAPKQAALDERLRRARQAMEREQEQASSQKMQTAISFGATLVGALLGKRAVTSGTVGRATTAVRGVGRAQKETQDVQRAQETIAAIEADRRRLDDDLAADTAAIESVADAATEPLEALVIKPKRGGVKVRLVALVWLRS
jgi:hypothetical protein